MFAGISRRYDFANHLLSGGMDFYWRRALVKSVRKEAPAHIVDLATGSGDVAFAIAQALPGAHILGLDFCEPMLDEARLKQKKSPGMENITFQFGDCLNLPCPDNTADVVTISFGLRNLEDRHQGLTEMLRILKPGGLLVILEFTQPASWFRPIYYVYLKTILPLLARLATGNRSAYDYLAGSIESFPTRESLATEIDTAGFAGVSARGLSASIVAIHQARKAL